MAGAIKSYRLQITGQTDFGKPRCVRAASRSTSLRILWNRYSTLVFSLREKPWTLTASAAATISSGPGPAEVQPEELQQENMHDSDTAIKASSHPHTGGTGTENKKTLKSENTICRKLSSYAAQLMPERNPN